MALKIGIVGCGAIGKSLAKYIVQDLSGKAVLSALYDLDQRQCVRISRRLATGTLGKLIKKSDLVIESASGKSSFFIAKSALLQGKDVMIMSVGGVLDQFSQLEKIAQAKKVRIFIPSGALAGIDGLKASKIGKIKKAVLTTYKNPASFQGVKYVADKKINLTGIKKDKVLFFGPASQAVKYFPQNINVAAVLALAGIGKEKTKVKIVASPRTKRNIHEILVESNAGLVRARTENVLHPDNPKTSFLAVLAAAATLKQILESARIGT